MNKNQSSGEVSFSERFQSRRLLIALIAIMSFSLIFIYDVDGRSIDPGGDSQECFVFEESMDGQDCCYSVMSKCDIEDYTVAVYKIDGTVRYVPKDKKILREKNDAWIRVEYSRDGETHNDRKKLQ